jgi:5'-nucleotidase
MKRRDFIHQTAASTALLSIAGIGWSCTKSKAAKITILHTNDVHSHIDPFGQNEGENSNKGGIARRAALVESVRKENKHTLLLDAGDIFQGTPYFNFYGGELEFRLMSLLKYDVATIGNHDFDNGITGLYSQLPHAKFDFISANYDFSNTIMDTHVKPYKTFIKGGVKIGVFGLGIELKGLVNKEDYKETKYLNPIEIAQDMSRILKTEEE